MTGYWVFLAALLVGPALLGRYLNAARQLDRIIQDEITDRRNAGQEGKN